MLAKNWLLQVEKGMTGPVNDSLALTRLLACDNGISVNAEKLKDETGSPMWKLDAEGYGSLKVGLLGNFRLLQDCLANSLMDIQRGLSVIAVGSTTNCHEKKLDGTDIIIYWSHSASASDPELAQKIVAIRRAYSSLPLLVFSDAEDTQRPRAIRRVLKSGAQGIISARTNGLHEMLAAIRVVASGGVFTSLQHSAVGN